MALAYHQAHAEHDIWQGRIEQSLRQAGATLPDKPKTKPPATWQCELCDKCFATRRALAMHAARSHGYKKRVRFYAVGSLCNACCTEFHSRKRLTVHYEHQQRCWDTVQACHPPMSEAVVEELDAQDRSREAELRKGGWWAAKAFDPALKVYGPALPPMDDPGSAYMHALQHNRCPSDANAFENLQGRKVDGPLPQQADFWYWHHDMPKFVFQSNGGKDAGAGAFALKGLAVEAARLHVRSLVIVHFFSGYRRAGDIHSLIEHRVTREGTHIFALDRFVHATQDGRPGSSTSGQMVEGPNLFGPSRCRRRGPAVRNLHHCTHSRRWPPPGERWHRTTWPAWEQPSRMGASSNRR